MEQRPSSDSQSQEDRASVYGKYSTLGIQFALFLVLFFLAGYWLDQQLGSQPLCMIVGLILGFIGGTVWLYRQVVPREPADGKNEEDRSVQDGEGRS